jgi:hypothetical protein
MFRRELLSSKGPWFREDIYPGEDGDLWLRLTKNRRVAFLNEVLSYYRHSPGGITRDRARYLRTSVEIHSDNLKRGMDIFDRQQVHLYRSKIAQQLFELGYEHCAHHDVQDARLAYKRSMGTAFRTRTLLAYLKTFAPEPIVCAYKNSVMRREAGGGGVRLSS